MKITKRQLRRLIRESHPRAVVDDAMVDYEMWVEEKGHITTGSSSVMATYILDKGIEDDHELHQTLADAFKLGHDDHRIVIFCIGITHVMLPAYHGRKYIIRVLRRISGLKLHEERSLFESYQPEIIQGQHQ